MKTKRLKFILLAFGAIFLTSCNNLLYTSLDVLRPAKVAFALDANSLLIVNNTVTQPANYGHTTELINKSPINNVISTDSLSIFCLGALTEDLETKGFFSSIQLIPNSINKGYDFFKPLDLNEDNVKNLCLRHHANAILSLDKITVNDKLSEQYLADSYSYLAALELQFKTYWSIHYFDKSPGTSIQFNDTSYWESESYVRRNTISSLPKRTDALIDGALDVGHNSTNRFVPYWEKVDRYFFNPNNRLMKQGMDSVYVKNWKSAINSWETALNYNKSIRIKAQASNNIAIAYEITGDVDKALEYATKSLNLIGEFTITDYESLSRLTDYIKDLIQRKIEIKTLKQQLGD